MNSLAKLSVETAFPSESLSWKPRWMGFAEEVRRPSERIAAS